MLEKRSVTLQATVILGLLVLPAATRAQGPAYLVKDINVVGMGSHPANLTDVNGTLFFAADDGVHGPKLWKSDGTESGTALVTDISPGTSGSNPRKFTKANGALFFVANDSDSLGVWKSDGTPEGTVRLIANPFVDSLADLNGTLFFAADGPWKSDGTEVGTVRVSGSPDGAANLTNVNGTLYFTTFPLPSVLWRSDGTTAGTMRVTQLGSSSRYSMVTGMASVNGTLFVVLYQEEPDEYQLWHIEDSAAVLVKGFGYLGNPPPIVAVEGTPFFFLGGEVWQTDGTTAGTAPVQEALGAAGIPHFSDVAVANGVSFLTSNDQTGHGLWRSNGTAAGTTLVKNFERVGAPSLTAANGSMFFAADDGGGPSLWKSDGTESGTVRVKAVSVEVMTNANGTLFLSADDAVTGAELWKSDGTESGTVRVKDINLNTLNSNPSGFTPANGMLFFTTGTLYLSTLDVVHPALWRSDGSADGTVLLKDTFSCSAPQATSPLLFKPAAAEDKVFFVFDNGCALELWKSDGSQAGTELIAKLHAVARSAYYPRLLSVAGTVFLDVDAGNDRQRELWRSDGTARGTLLIGAFDTESSVSEVGSFAPVPLNLTDFNGALFFHTANGLWKSDGTAAGTSQIKVFPFEPSAFTIAGRYLYFAPDFGGPGIWRSDGTAAGTLLISNLGRPDTYLTELTDVNGTLFFVADSTELWRTDGTRSGTVRVGVGTDSVGIAALTNVDGTLFFINADSQGLATLWKSDGSAAGTVQVASPGALDHLTPAGNLLIFAAGGSTWKSDGTSAGTVRVQGIAPPQSYSDFAFMAVGSKLFLAADDGRHGIELWAAPLSALVSSCPGDCNGDIMVTIDEVLRGVNIALSNLPLDHCRSLDSNNDDSVTVDELVAAVGAALSGCR